jgi:Flp pilus assembly protein TadD
MGCSLLLLTLAACSANQPPTTKASSQVSAAAADLHRDHGWSALRAERYKDAASYFQRVLKDRPEDASARLGLGEAYLGQGRLKDASAQFEQIGDGAGSGLRAKAFQGQGLVHLRQGKQETAWTFLEKAVQRDAGLWRSWNALGRLHDARRDHDGARKAYRRAITLNPKAAFLHNNLGFSLLASGEPAFAEEALNRALALDPELDAAATNLRLALALQGHYGPALAGADPENRAAIMNNVGYAALLRGDHERAKSLFLSAMAADPGFFDEAKRNLAYVEALQSEQTLGR